jgi:CheY-like chemotaxis protein
MPDDQVYTLVHQIKELESAQGKQIATIALIAAASSGDRRQAFRSGFQICLTQPVDIAELVSSLASLTGLLADN